MSQAEFLRVEQFAEEYRQCFVNISWFMRILNENIARQTNGEDQARMREGYSAENFSILHRIAVNLIRQDKNTKAGVKNRRLLAGWDKNYRQKIL